MNADKRCEKGHVWRAAGEGGWRASIDGRPRPRIQRPAVAVEIVYCERCEACVDIPAELVDRLRLPSDLDDTVGFGAVEHDRFCRCAMCDGELPF